MHGTSLEYGADAIRRARSDGGRARGGGLAAGGAGVAATPAVPVRASISSACRSSCTARDGQLVRGLTAGRLRGPRGRQAAEDRALRRGRARRGAAAASRAVLDASGSMETDLREAASAAIQFVQALDEAVDVTFVDFDTSVRVGPLQPAELPAAVRADPRPEGRRHDGALRRARACTSKRRRRRGRTARAPALHGRRRQHEPDDASASCSELLRLGNVHGLRDRLPREPV